MSALAEIEELRATATKGRRLFYTIASIYPWPLSQERPSFQPKPIFELKAVEKGQPPSYVTFGDAHQVIGSANSIMGRYPVTVSAEDIANDLIAHWTQSHLLANPEGHPGVWICDGDEPTKEEIARAEDVQAVYFNRLVQQADEVYANEKRRQILNANPIFKVAAKWLGIEGRAWQQEITASSAKLCQWCRTNIASDSIVCAKCGNVVDQKAYAALKASMDPSAPQPASVASQPGPPRPAVQPQVKA